MRHTIKLRDTTVSTGIRWSVSAAWLVEALLLERIVTVGGITDLSGASQNPPLFVAVGLALIVLAIGIAITVAADRRPWPAISIAAGAAYVVVGVWLRLTNDDDSGAVIALIALLGAVLSRRGLGVRQRQTGPTAPPPSA